MEKLERSEAEQIGFCPISCYFYRLYFGVHINVHGGTIRSLHGVGECLLRSGHAGLGSNLTFAILFTIFLFCTKRLNVPPGNIRIRNCVTSKY